MILIWTHSNSFLRHNTNGVVVVMVIGENESK